MDSSTSHLADRVVMVTGATGGFGRLVCQGAAARGAGVVVTDIDSAAVDTLTENLIAQGANAIGHTVDVTNLDDLQLAVGATIDHFGALDVMVNNAGVMPLAFLSDHEAAADAWSRCIDINIKGVLNGMIAVHDQMIEQGRGHIVNLSSIYSNHPVAGAAVYGATKAAVNVMSEAVRVETQGKIKVTIVRPTGVPGTGLGGGVINPEAIVGILGQNAPTYIGRMGAIAEGQGAPEETDNESIRNAMLDPEDLADQILYAIDQPWGVSIGDITVRASGDAYIL